jgi:release factor glutamine methyltransferase
MDTIRKGIIERLKEVYDKNEAALMAKYLMDDLFSDGLIDNTLLNKAVDRLLNNEPLQYVTGKAYFLDYCFYVDKNVLIPRPETEELVMAVVSHIKKKNLKQILEVGTGSGCIAIAIKKMCPDTDIIAIDISEGALKVARKNAIDLSVEIDFRLMDFLDESLWSLLPAAELVVSNPPYISYSEKQAMHANVLDNEPHIALFAGEDALLFYKKIAKYSALIKANVYCEINEYLVEKTQDIFLKNNYLDVNVIKDLQGKNRMIRAI